jgi:mono/diheme cytochrome c family protein
MSDYRSRRGARRRKRRIDEMSRGHYPGRRGSDREIAIETDEDDQESGPSSLVPRFLRRLGPKGRFLGFATLIALIITVFWISYERHAAETEVTADRFNEAQVSLGGSLYIANCAFCHGDNLEGKPGWDGHYPSGRRPALPLNGETEITRLSDQDIMDVTKYGGQPFSPADYENDMPGFEMQLSDADIWAIVAFIKSRWSDEAIERQRQTQEQLSQ